MTLSDGLQYGISPLHARIRSVVYFTHIVSNIEYKHWKVDPLAEPIRDEGLQQIRKEFRSRLGLRKIEVTINTDAMHMLHTSVAPYIESARVQRKNLRS